MKNFDLKATIGIVFLIAMIMFVYVMIFSEIKNLNLEKLRKTELLNERKNKIELTKVERQKLMNEDRIVKIASDSLGLIIAPEQYETINVSKNQIKQIQSIVDEKYEQ